MPRTLLTIVVGALVVTPSLVATRAVAREAGDVVVADNIGVPLYTHNFDTGKDVGIGDKLFISEFIGAHYFAGRSGSA